MHLMQHLSHHSRKQTIFHPSLTEVPTKGSNPVVTHNQRIGLISILIVFLGITLADTGQATQCEFKAQGISRTGLSYTVPITMSLSDCQNACAADSRCLAFTYNNHWYWNTCSHHDSTEIKSIGCIYCTYYLKFCAPTTSMFTFLCHIIFQQLLFCVVDSFLFYIYQVMCIVILYM